jgi:hypothetical protein
MFEHHNFLFFSISLVDLKKSDLICSQVDNSPFFILFHTNDSALGGKLAAKFDQTFFLCLLDFARVSENFHSCPFWI